MKIGEFLAVGLLGIVLIWLMLGLVGLPLGFGLMILWGIIHASIPAVPAFGFLASYLMVLVVGGFGARSTVKSS